MLDGIGEFSRRVLKETAEDSERQRLMREALELIATPQRPDGTWNRDREACRLLALKALGRDDGTT